jgi:hypothetical protein
MLILILFPIALIDLSFCINPGEKFFMLFCQRLNSTNFGNIYADAHGNYSTFFSFVTIQLYYIFTAEAAKIAEVINVFCWVEIPNFTDKKEFNAFTKMYYSQRTLPAPLNAKLFIWGDLCAE